MELRTERKNKILEFMNSPLYTPMKEKELAILLQCEQKDRPMLSSILNELISEGRITINKRGLYRVAEAVPMEGVFSQNPKGFGFIKVADEQEDYYVAPENIGNAMDGDTVVFVEIPAQRGRSREAQILSIKERAMKTVCGLFRKNGHIGFILPDNQKLLSDIYVSEENSMGAVSGHKVVAEFVSYGDEKHKPEARIIEILGHKNEPGVDILSIVRAFSIPESFPEMTLYESEEIPQTVPEEDKKDREDLRDLPMVTIDGLDAKDLDDAVSLKVTENSEGTFYELGVHIADVSHYVTEGSALDTEALNRTTSVYLADRVIPMLPVALSNGICSLNAGEDRLALSVLMKLDSYGNMLDYRIVRSVILVKRRMSYEGVLALLEGRECELPELKDLPPELKTMLFDMASLAGILYEKRTERGAIDFEIPECKISLDDRGEPVTIKPYIHNKATDMIEDFMLLANETVAQHYFWLGTPFLYRVHTKPDPEKVKELSNLISAFGYSFKKSGESVHPKEIQKLLTKVKDKEEGALIERLTLRSLRQAGYSTNNVGHFGLALQYYSHFTSPIRRYPDLQIHRIITEDLKGTLTEERLLHYREILDAVALRSSKLERRAAEAERETEKLKKCQYMKHHIGEVFDGIISGVTSWGIYVELPDTVEGLVHVSDMTDDRYEFNEKTLTLSGRKYLKTYSLGMKVKVLVNSVDTVMKTIDFLLYRER